MSAAKARAVMDWALALPVFSPAVASGSRSISSAHKVKEEDSGDGRFGRTNRAKVKDEDRGAGGFGSSQVQDEDRCAGGFGA